MAGLHNWRVSVPWPEGISIGDGEDRAIAFQYEDDEGKTHEDFDDGHALAAMLLGEAVFLNSYWWEGAWPEECRKLTAICVNTNDVFAWGVADAEQIARHEIEEVYRYWAKDPREGIAVWAMIRHKELAQRPVLDAIRKDGIWDLDALTKEHGLRPNCYDGISHAVAALKRERYIEWAKATGRKVAAWTAAWWGEWTAFTEANPAWCDDAWKAEETRRIAAWKAENGYADATQSSEEPSSQSEACIGKPSASAIAQDESPLPHKGRVER